MAQPTLPSIIAAEALLKGEEGAWGKILWSLLQRSAIIAPALYLAGERERILKYTAFSAIAIELVVLWEVKKQLEKKDA